METLVFEFYTRKREHPPPNCDYQAVYLLPGMKPGDFVRDEWEFHGRAFPPKSATIAELRKAKIYRDVPTGIDPKLLWQDM